VWLSTDTCQSQLGCLQASHNLVSIYLLLPHVHPSTVPLFIGASVIVCGSEMQAVVAQSLSNGMFQVDLFFARRIPIHRIPDVMLDWVPSLRPIGYPWSYLACRIGLLVPFWKAFNRIFVSILCCVGLSSGCWRGPQAGCQQFERRQQSEAFLNGDGVCAAHHA
jgi:hypothetical protein